jgi:pimeloyl-ACP methyl ester carboxylesterase
VNLFLTHVHVSPHDDALTGTFAQVFAYLRRECAARPFPVLLICDAKDVALPCRHTERIYDAARGPKQMWVVPGAFHTAALGYQPEEFRRRVLAFYDSVR